MEKFSQWRDPSTGIQPFLPPKKPVQTLSTAANLARYARDFLLGPLLAALRLPFVVIVSLWLCLMLLLSQLIFVPVVRLGFRRYVQFLGCRALLLLAGYWWISSESVSLRRRRDDGGAKAKWPPGMGLSSGDVVLANYTSYVDILYLGFRYGPVFTQIFTRNGNEPQVSVRKLSLFQALHRCVSAPQVSSSSSEGAAAVHSLEQVVKEARDSRQGPVVVFPEGTTSNNRCLLAFLPVFGTWRPAKEQFQLVGFKHDYEEFCPCYTAGNPLVHLLRLLCQPANKLEVYFLDRADNPEWDAAGSALASSMAQLLNLRKARLSLEDKAAFWDYFAIVRSGYRPSASRTSSESKKKQN